MSSFSDELGFILLIGMHTVVTAITTGDVSKAIIICLTSVICFLLVVGAIWCRNQIIPKKPATKRRSQRKVNRKGALKKK